MKSKFQKLLAVPLIVVVLSLAAFTPVVQQATRFRSIFVEHNATIGGTLDMDNGAISNIGAAGTDFGSDGSLTTAAGVTVSAGNLTVSNGDAVIADFAQIAAQTAISLTNGGILTPTGTFQPIQSGGAVTVTMSSGCSTGQEVLLVNRVNQTIIISETDTSALSDNASLGQYDSLHLLCDTSRWIQIAPESDN
ncbi:MAG: hypothetical protein BroJett011_03940 [Chloroflexota bacterium]|nr:MAG: hypothetical protein BroJett011_03940 [Chloroflexota bacterium]